MKDPDLWSRIRSCHPDDVEADFPFSGRLARDNGWTPAYAQRAILEYQRFAYLTRLGEGMVTPSDEVDQAWHLHLTYTRHYWGPFRDALGGALHHMPTKGGPDQAALFRQAYAKTLDLYRREFGDPPADLWPEEAIRFGRAPHFKRVNSRDYLLLPRPKWPRFVLQGLHRIRSVPASAYGLCLAGLALMFGTGLAFAHGQPKGDTLFEQLRSMVWHWAFEHTLWFLVGVSFCVFVLFKILEKSSGGKSSGCGGGGCSSGGSGCGSGCGGCGD